jgi:CheY-like chemotaxis protein
MNLCTNAHHAMREHGGILEIVLQNKLVAPDGDILIPDIIPGDYLVLSVKDTGSGMDAVTLEQIFNPYFTTKEKGEGTGLGLSVVHGIIKKHKGAIKVFSQQGLGTQFDIYLPLIEEKVVNEFIEEKSELPEGKGRILFVDDEEVLVEMGQEMLASLGYQVDSVVNSIKALEMFNRNPDKWDIVITDFTMPGMTGVKLATEILGIRPDIPVLICTGYSEGVTIKTDAKQGIRKVLMKPVAMGDFAKAIKEFLP